MATVAKEKPIEIIFQLSFEEGKMANSSSTSCSFVNEVLGENSGG